MFTKNGSILCKDVNIKTKHVKPMNEGESGSIIQESFRFITERDALLAGGEEEVESWKKMEGDKVDIEVDGRSLAN